MEREQITRLNELPVANERLYAEVAKQMKCKPKEIKDIIQFVGAYTADKIRSGTMETVMLPYFGKFRPKIRLLARKISLKVAQDNGTDTLARVIEGKKTDKPKYPYKDAVKINMQKLPPGGTPKPRGAKKRT